MSDAEPDALSQLVGEEGVGFGMNEDEKAAEVGLRRQLWLVEMVSENSLIIMCMTVRLDEMKKHITETGRELGWVGGLVRFALLRPFGGCGSRGGRLGARGRGEACRDASGVREVVACCG